MPDTIQLVSAVYAHVCISQRKKTRLKVTFCSAAPHYRITAFAPPASPITSRPAASWSMRSRWPRVPAPGRRPLYITGAAIRFPSMKLRRFLTDVMRQCFEARRFTQRKRLLCSVAPRHPALRDNSGYAGNGVFAIPAFLDCSA